MPRNKYIKYTFYPFHFKESIQGMLENFNPDVSQYLQKTRH